MDPAQALVARETERHKNINEMIARGDSPVQQFYAGAVVLVTGASGFLGKQLIEKLFRSCQIKKAYVLLRRKKDRTIYERWTAILQDQVYEYLHENQPNFVDKIVLVEADMTLPGLGINEKDWNAITKDVNVIFHVAATVNFAEPIKKATMTNVHGTKETILLARECINLKSFVHISTAYTHAKKANAGQDVLEQFYESPTAPDALIRMVEETEETVLEIMTPQIIKGWPNTYSFTKALAEELVRTMAADLPVCIVRPAIVVCTYREPIPGWIDKSTAFGGSGIVVGSGLGVLHVLYADDENKLDLVPVDVVNNAAITAAYDTAQRRARGLTDVKIYTVCSTRNPINYGMLVHLLAHEGRKFSTNASMWYAYAITAKYKLLYNLLFFFVDYLPGVLVDAVLLLVGKKAILTKVYNKVHVLSTVLSFYATHTWNFGDSNLQELYWSLSPADRTIFNSNIDNLDWPLYIVLWCIGCRKYIIKDGLKDTVAAVRKQRIFRILYYIFITIYGYALYKLGFSILKACYQVFGLVF